MGSFAVDAVACTLLSSKDGLTGGGAAAGAGGTGADTAGTAGTTSSSSSGGTGGQAGGGGQLPSKPPSCEGLEDLCGNGKSCCETRVVDGGFVLMGEGGQPPTGPEHSVHVPGFRLDTFEVTVGRFRNFVAAMMVSQELPEGAGSHPLLPGSGWQTGWWELLPESGLLWDGGTHSKTWSADAGSYEYYPINMVPWYTAFAFCAWDNGWLPTEAEWELAASGGSENRPYPWGNAEPDGNLAVYGTDDGSNPFPDAAFLPVGSKPEGVGKFGQLDLAGSMAEWTMDWWDDDWYLSHDGTGGFAANVNYLGSATERTMRGGAWEHDASYLRSAHRWGVLATQDGDLYRADVGFRCARALPDAR